MRRRARDRDREPIRFQPASRRRRGKRPLAERLRPERLEDYVGQDIYWARETAAEADRNRYARLDYSGGDRRESARPRWRGWWRGDQVRIHSLQSAVGLAESKKSKCHAERREFPRLGRGTIVFIDKSTGFQTNAARTRFCLTSNVATIILIGATTENPSFEVIAALLSRSKVYALRFTQVPEIVTLLQRGAEDLHVALRKKLGAESPSFERRRASRPTTRSSRGRGVRGGRSRPKAIEDSSSGEGAALHNQRGALHLISALHKSVRSSDVDGALYLLARMPRRGEDRMFIARRWSHGNRKTSAWPILAP